MISSFIIVLIILGGGFLFGYFARKLIVSRSIDSAEAKAEKASAALTNEVAQALRGTMVAGTRMSENGDRVVSVSIPIQHVRAVLGVLTLEAGDVDSIIAAERRALLPFILVAISATLVSSILLHRLIAEPVMRLARAADRVRLEGARAISLPDIAKRQDEIGDLSLTLQPKLLRALETQTFRRVGGQKELQVDVRFVAATNRDLAAMVKAGSFREDLYYRLNVGSIEMPPLRARTSDILPLAQHFIGEAAKMMNMPHPELDRQCCELIEQYPWPGNIRELRNVMERALILCGGERIVPSHLPKEIVHGTKGSAIVTDDETLSLAEVEKRHIRRVLNASRGNKTQAAKTLGITRLTLRTKIAEYGWDEFLDKHEPAR